VEQWLAACSPPDSLDHLYVVARPNDAFTELLGRFLAEQQAEEQADTQNGQRCTVLTAANAQLGMGNTLATAVAQIPHGALVIGLADMPWVTPATLKLLARTLRESATGDILQPRYNGQSGNPLGFGPAHRVALEQCSGDQGARALVQQARSNKVLTDSVRKRVKRYARRCVREVYD